MGQAEKKELIRAHAATLWTAFANVFLGFWLLVSHVVLNYHDMRMTTSDMITGAIFVIFGFLSLSRRYLFAPWIICLGGVWLQLAPLLFWASEPGAYMNDTLIGVLAISFSILIPGLPGVVTTEGNAIPPGWSYNPSAWIQRIPVIALGFTGWMISRYLAAYQLGYIDTVWDPLFGEGTKLVITSSISRALPIPDAGLGALAYTLETLLGCKGGQNRWRTMPWMVVFFALLVVPVGIVSILLIILQPLLVGHWCFLCLVTAAAMLIMVVLTLDEMLAVILFLYQSVKEGKGFWRTFFKGGDPIGSSEDKRTPSFEGNLRKILASLTWGVGFRWNLALTALLGIFLMLMPSLFNFGGALADSSHLFGALTVAISIIALAEVARTLRFVLVPFGLWIILSAAIIPCCCLFVNWLTVLIGGLLIALSYPKGRIHQHYGPWNKHIH